MTSGVGISEACKKTVGENRKYLHASIEGIRTFRTRFLKRSSTARLAAWLALVQEKMGRKGGRELQHVVKRSR